MAEHTERIDVMLPFYGDAGLFREAVESVLAQSYPHWRLVCVDDAYPSDEAGAWLRSLNDDRIVSLRNEKNLGVAGNFNYCLSLVTASHFVMMGGDDVMLPGFLRKLDDVRRSHPEADVFQCGVDVIDADGRKYLPLADRVKALIRPNTRGQVRVLRGQEMAESLVRADWAYFPSLMWQTSTVAPLGFDTRFAVALDLGLLLEIALAGGRLALFDETLFRYRRHRMSVSQATAVNGERFTQEGEFFTYFAGRFSKHGWVRAARIARRRIMARMNAMTALPLAARNRDRDAWSRLVRFILR